MVDEPLATPVTNPVEEPTVAFDVSDEVQVAAVVTLLVDPSVYVAVAIS